MSYINPTNTQKVQTNFTRKARRKPTAHHENKALQTTQRDTMAPTSKNSAHQIGPSYTARRTRRRSPTRDAAAQEKILEFPPPPPGVNKELWDLQFSRWWGWNWVRKQEEENLRKSALFNRRNNSNPSKHYITPRPKIEPYKENRFQQFCKFMKDIYSTAKTKITEKTVEPRIKHSFYTMHHPKKKRYDQPLSPRKMYPSSHFYIGHTAASQNASISSLFVQAQSRRKKYQKTQRNMDSWIVERNESSSSEEEERIVTCMSVEETYTTSTEGDVNYLAARMKKICNNDGNRGHVKQKECPRKYIFVRNKGTQSNLNKEETLTKSVDNEEMKIERVTGDKVDATTETPAGLIDKEHFASPLTGHLYKINIPEVPIPDVKYPTTGKMFDFINQTDFDGLTMPSDLDKNTEHQKLLNAVYEALLTSRERPVMNHYYDDSFQVYNERISTGAKTKKLFVAPKMVSSSSFHDFSSSDSTRTTTTNRDIQFTVKRKSPFNSSSTTNSDTSPPKTIKKSVKEPSSSSAASSRKRILNYRRTPKLSSSVLETNDCLPVILEDVSTNNSNKNKKKQPVTNPFIQKTPDSSRASSGIENYCKLQRDINTAASKGQSGTSDAKSLATQMQQSKISVGSQNLEEEDAIDTTNASQTSATTKHSWNVTLNNIERGGRKSNIPIAVYRNVSNSKKRKLN